MSQLRIIFVRVVLEALAVSLLTAWLERRERRQLQRDEVWVELALRAVIGFILFLFSSMSSEALVTSCGSRFHSHLHLHFL